MTISELINLHQDKQKCITSFFLLFVNMSKYALSYVCADLHK